MNDLIVRISVNVMAKGALCFCIVRASVKLIIASYGCSWDITSYKSESCVMQLECSSICTK